MIESSQSVCNGMSRSRVGGELVRNTHPARACAHAAALHRHARTEAVRYTVADQLY